MAPRAFWTGNLRLSLVTIPVSLYPATSTERKIEFHQIHEPSGKRIRYQKIAPGVGPVENEEITKGFEYEKGKYVLLDQKEIDELKLESKQTIELVRFVETRSAREAAPLVSELRSRAEELRTVELDRYRTRLEHLDTRDRETIEALTRGILAKLLHEPTVRLKDAAGTPRGDRLADAMRDLFDL